MLDKEMKKQNENILHIKQTKNNHRKKTQTDKHKIQTNNNHTTTTNQQKQTNKKKHTKNKKRYKQQTKNKRNKQSSNKDQFYENIQFMIKQQEKFHRSLSIYPKHIIDEEMKN